MHVDMNLCSIAIEPTPHECQLQMACHTFQTFSDFIFYCHTWELA